MNRRSSTMILLPILIIQSFLIETKGISIEETKINTISNIHLVTAKDVEPNISGSTTQSIRNSRYEFLSR